MFTKRFIHSFIFVAVILGVWLSQKSIYAYGFSKIDNHALNTPSSAERSIDTLSRYLTKLAKNDFEKVRAIFRWVTQNIAYDTNAYFSGSFGDLSPESVLQSRKAVCDGYAGIFNKLANASGLESLKIGGFSKGYGYSVGQKLGDKSDHAWNAVKIDAKWYLLDATWGAGYLDAQKRYIRKFQKHYFLTPPKQFIYDHLPEESKWQLLNKPISKRDYEDLVYLRPGFFNHNLKIISDHKKSLINVNNKVNIKLSAPKDVLLLVSLQKGNQLFKNYTFIQKKDNKYNLLVTLPESGDYNLRIFAKRKSVTTSYPMAYSYKVIAKSGDRGGSFPQTYEDFTKNNAYLYNPMNGVLKAGSTTNFKINVPGAEKVAVVSGKQWFHLEKKGSEFKGDVKVLSGDVVIYAQFPGQKNYSGLLKYKAR